jgi:hypothetical protein
VRSDEKSAKRLKFTQDQLSIERATRTEAEKKKTEAEKKVRQAEVAKDKLRLAADKAVRYKCKALTVKNNSKLKLQEKNATLKELKAKSGCPGSPDGRQTCVAHEGARSPVHVPNGTARPLANGAGEIRAIGSRAAHAGCIVFPLAGAVRSPEISRREVVSAAKRRNRHGK